MKQFPQFVAPIAGFASDPFAAPAAAAAPAHAPAPAPVPVPAAHPAAFAAAFPPQAGFAAQPIAPTFAPAPTSAPSAPLNPAGTDLFGSSAATSDVVSIWSITEPKKAEYDHIFDAHATGGFLEGGKAFPLFVSSGLPKPVLAQIWELCKVNPGDTRLNKAEFAIAQHLIFVKKGGKDLPATLPDDLRATSENPVKVAKKETFKGKYDAIDRSNFIAVPPPAPVPAPIPVPVAAVPPPSRASDVFISGHKSIFKKKKN